MASVGSGEAWGVAYARRWAGRGGRGLCPWVDRLRRAVGRLCGRGFCQAVGGLWAWPRPRTDPPSRTERPAAMDLKSLQQNTEEPKRSVSSSKVCHHEVRAESKSLSCSLSPVPRSGKLL